MKKLLYPIFMILLIALTSCGIANFKTDEMAMQTNAQAAEVKGRTLLENAVEKMGYDKLAATETYAMTAHFDWAIVWSMMPMNALPGNKNKDIRFRFATNTFDGQVEFLEGGRQGNIYGLQSWESYKIEDGETEADDLKSKRYPWGLATYHYMTETPTRLLGADVIRYAGSRTVGSQEYEVVFVTWGDGNNKKDYDQWLVYLNKETGFVDLTEVTITDFFLPMPGNMKNATIRYAEREKTSIGAWLPTKTVIQLGHPKKKLSNDVYTFTFRDFEFDGFPLEQLYPLEGLMRYGDSKPESK